MIYVDEDRPKFRRYKRYTNRYNRGNSPNYSPSIVRIHNSHVTTGKERNGKVNG